jgi:hypothetical protein
LADLWIKLREIDDKLDKVRGDVNMIATLNKEQNRGVLLASCQAKFGRSLDAQRLWYFADVARTIPQLARLSRVKPGTAQATLWKLRDRGLLVKNDLADLITYVRSEITEGIGLERWVEGCHRDKNVELVLPQQTTEAGLAMPGPSLK